MKVKIRKATKKDIKEARRLHFLHAAFWADLEKDHMEVESRRAKSAIRRDILSYFKDTKKKAIFLAEIDRSVVGYCGVIIQKTEPNFRYKKKGFISELYVEKRWRGKGIGKKLLQAAIKWCKAKGVKWIVTDTSIKNRRAINLYKKIGFDSYHICFRMKK